MLLPFLESLVKTNLFLSGFSATARQILSKAGLSTTFAFRPSNTISYDEVNRRREQDEGGCFGHQGIKLKIWQGHNHGSGFA